jgi:hypothetical protein
MVEGNDERRIDYGIVVGERRMHGSEEIREKKEEPQLRSSGNARGCKELEKVGGAM